MNTTEMTDEIKMPRPKKVLYTAKVRTTGGRDGGSSRSSDGRLEVKLTLPGNAGDGTNPEQLFAAAWSNCFTSAMKGVAAKNRVPFPEGAFVDAEVDLCLEDNNRHFIRARLNVSLPGIDHDMAETIVHTAHQYCTYSQATRGNIDVQINLV
jgi:lipoyl-dependent peroxiredoxin